MKKHDKPVNKGKLTDHEINMKAMTYEPYFQRLAKNMLQKGASEEDVEKEIGKYSHMY